MELKYFITMRHKKDGFETGPSFFTLFLNRPLILSPFVYAVMLFLHLGHRTLVALSVGTRSLVWQFGHSTMR